MLSLVSSLCQGLGPTVLQSVDHMILFAHASLERACKHLHGEEAMLLGSFEAETVMFAFGLLSTLLVGTTKVIYVSIENEVFKNIRQDRMIQILRVRD